MITAPTLLAVAAGGALGACARFVVGRWAAVAFGPGFPVGTLIVNVAGGLLMGLLAVVLVERAPGSWGGWAPFAMSGVLGGFTTFSAFSLEVLMLVERGEPARALLYVALSVGLSVGALWLGLLTARAL